VTCKNKKKQVRKRKYPVEGNKIYHPHFSFRPEKKVPDFRKNLRNFHPHILKPLIMAN
jgi:hypothetical protein